MFGSKKILGLDIGTSTIKIAELDVSKKGAVLHSFALANTPPNAISGGEIVDPTMLSDTITGLLAEIKSKRKNVATGMWGTAVIVKRIGIPKMEINLVADQIRWEAEQYIPFDINEINLSHHVLNGHSSRSEMLEVLLIAAKQDLVLQYAEVTAGAGLQCSVVDVSGFALANCFELNYGVESDSCVGLLNVGSGVTNFVVVEDGEVVFCRDIPVGGGTFTNEIHKELGIQYEEAEALKLSASLGEVPAEVHSVISATNEAVSEEIKNSFEFFGATSNGTTISKCYFSGGGALTPGLIDQVTKSVNIPFESFNPFARLPANSKTFSPGQLDQIRPFAAIVVGLALRQLGDER